MTHLDLTRTEGETMAIPSVALRTVKPIVKAKAELMAPESRAEAIATLSHVVCPKA